LKILKKVFNEVCPDYAVLELDPTAQEQFSLDYNGKKSIFSILRNTFGLLIRGEFLLAYHELFIGAIYDRRSWSSKDTPEMVHALNMAQHYGSEIIYADRPSHANNY